MKLFAIGFVTCILGVFLWYSIMIGTGIRSCTAKYQETLTSSRVQIDSLKGDHHLYCSISYDTINSWKDCVNVPLPQLPIQVDRWLRPNVLAILRITGEPSADIAGLMSEHDDLCKDQTDFMFVPPVRE